MSDGYRVSPLEALPDVVLYTAAGETVPWHWVSDFVANLALRVGDGELLELYDDETTFDEDGAVVDGEVVARAQLVTVLPPGLFVAEIALPGMETFERVQAPGTSSQLVEYDIGRREGLPLIARRGAVLSAARLLDLLAWVFLEGCLPPGWTSNFPEDMRRDQQAGIRAPDDPEEEE